MDLGAEYRGFTADVTCNSTSGKFTTQKETIWFYEAQKGWYCFYTQ
jgi:Xaa-Pro aminopeptidase